MPTKTAAQEAFDTIVARSVAPVLKSSGFAKSGLNWRKTGGAGVGVINVQKSWRGTRDGIQFTVNLGVRYDAVHRADYPDAPWMWDKQPVEPDCHLRDRLGCLAPAGRDLWWSIDASTNIDVVGDEVRDLLVRYGLPFVLGKMDDATVAAGILARRGSSRTRHLPAPGGTLPGA